MVYTMPRYIQQANIDTPDLHFTWDDWKASELFTYNSDAVAEKLMKLEPRAQVAMGVGIYEWIVWRFRRVTDDPLPYQLAEAAWLGVANPFYMSYVELERREWMGPIRGALWCAVTWMVPMVFYKQKGEEELESGLRYLPRLAVHVLPDPRLFEEWINFASNRLLYLYQAKKNDLFDDLFALDDHDDVVIPREALDPEFEYSPDRAKKLFQKFLKSSAPEKNQVLNTPEQMRTMKEEHTLY
jgi:hypothetical protein